MADFEVELRRFLEQEYRSSDSNLACYILKCLDNYGGKHICVPENALDDEG